MKTVVNKERTSKPIISMRLFWLKSNYTNNEKVMFGVSNQV